MRNRVLKPLIISTCLLTLTVGFASTTHAGLIPWLYDAIFGPVQPGYGVGYHGAGYYGYGAGHYGGMFPATYGSASVGYAPMMSPGYSPCGPASCPTTVGYAPECSPCAAGYAPYAGDISAGGSCFAPPSTTTSTPGPRPEPIPMDGGVPDYDGSPRTFDNPSDRPSPPAEQQPPMDDEGFRPRQPADEEPERMEAFSAPREAIQQRQPAPMDDPEDGNANNPAEPQADDVNSNGGPDLMRLPVPQFRLEDRITWRVTPQRKRLAVRAHFENPVVARSRVDVNADWTPVAKDTKIVSK